MSPDRKGEREFGPEDNNIPFTNVELEVLGRIDMEPKPYSRILDELAGDDSQQRAAVEEAINNLFNSPGEGIIDVAVRRKRAEGAKGTGQDDIYFYYKLEQGPALEESGKLGPVRRYEVGALALMRNIKEVSEEVTEVNFLQKLLTREL